MLAREQIQSFPWLNGWRVFVQLIIKKLVEHQNSSKIQKTSMSSKFLMHSLNVINALATVRSCVSTRVALWNKNVKKPR